MPIWEPILDKELGERADVFLKLIAKKLDQEFSSQKVPDLLTGKTGQLLFLSHYLGGNARTIELLESLIADISTKANLDGSLIRGLAGTGFVLKIINDKFNCVDEELLNDFYSLVRRFAKKDIYEGNFDFMYGYMGECCFLLEDEICESNFSLFSEALSILQKQAIPQAKGVGWISIRELRINYPKADYSQIQKDCNLGLSHGLPGIIAILSKIMVKYPKLEVAGIWQAALECLLNEESPDYKEKHGFYYSIYSGELGKKYKGQLSWCYSDLGISLMYYNLWELTRQPEMLERANRLAFSCLEKNLEDVPGMCSGLCHGAAGIAHMFNKIYNKTNNAVFKEKAIYWYTVLFDHFLIFPNDGSLIQSIDINRKTGMRKISTDNGFLEGLAGIGLSIYAGISNDYPTWDKLLLL